MIHHSFERYAILTHIKHADGYLAYL